MEATALGFHLRYSRSIASAGASLFGARAALHDRLKVFLPWQSYGKSDSKLDVSKLHS
jgi:hypothetical protein